MDGHGGPHLRVDSKSKQATLFKELQRLQTVVVLQHLNLPLGFLSYLGESSHQSKRESRRDSSTRTLEMVYCQYEEMASFARQCHVDWEDLALIACW